MNKSKVSLTAGALILAVTAIFATKANKQFFYNVLTAYAGDYRNQSNVKEGFTEEILTTKNNSALALLMYISGSNKGALVTTTQNGRGKRVFFR
jgi:hypothetical protein